MRFVDELSSPAPDASALPASVDELRAGAVDTLIITAWNPVYRAPVDVPLAKALGAGASHGVLRARGGRDGRGVHLVRPLHSLL